MSDSKDTMNIGGLSAATSVSAKLIRHYEMIGLIPAAVRNESGYRLYNENDVHTLRFIKRARTLGFSLEEIKRLLGLWQNRQRASQEVKALALTHLRNLETKIAEMQTMADTLRHLASCCRGDHRPDCPILEDLAGGDALPQRSSRNGYTDRTESHSKKARRLTGFRKTS